MKQPVIVLGLHPTYHGFGWVLFEGATAPLDWGAARPKANTRDAILARLNILLAQYCPSVLAIEAFDGEDSRRAPRIRALAADMVRVSEARGVEVVVYSRIAILKGFPGMTGSTREDVAEAVADRIVRLRPRLPKRRKSWESEHPSLSLFSAAACALAWYAQQV